MEHVIPLLPDSQPPAQQMYRLAPSELPKVQQQVIDLLAKQLIELSTSPFGAPILFVEKKTGNLRVVVDYRALDKIKVKSRDTLPQINDLLNKLFGAQYFSCLDAASGFHQILLRDEDNLILHSGPLLILSSLGSFPLAWPLHQLLTRQ